jgi:hypothetical protein
MARGMQDAERDKLVIIGDDHFIARARVD